jgi:SAM-dependent methyltransferase
MHPTSYLKMKAFRDAHLIPVEEGPLTVLDVGAACHAGQRSYRSLFPAPVFAYRGADMVEGHNVDVVLAEPHRWDEIATASVDVVVSGQMMEHDPYFWVTMCEIGRVLRPGGWCCIIAPSRGPAHYFPRDCWRFYPDSGAALMAFAGLTPVESQVEPASFRSRRGVEWGDMLAIGRLPPMGPEDHGRHLTRLASVVSAVPDVPLPASGPLRGGAVVRYERSVRRMPIAWRPYLARKAWAHLKMRIWNGASVRLRTTLTRLASRTP